MAAGDRYIDCNNRPYEPVEALIKQLFRIDDSGYVYLNTWASGADPEDVIGCNEEWTAENLFYASLVYDADNNLAVATF